MGMLILGTRRAMGVVPRSMERSSVCMGNPFIGKLHYILL